MTNIWVAGVFKQESGELVGEAVLEAQTKYQAGFLMTAHLPEGTFLGGVHPGHQLPKYLQVKES